MSDMRSLRLVTLATYGSTPEARIACSLLESEGIHAYLEGDHAVTTLWYVGTALGGVKLQVALEDVEAARAVLAQANDNSDDPAEQGPMHEWECPKCLHTVDAGFGACWSCGRPFDERERKNTIPPSHREPATLASPGADFPLVANEPDIADAETSVTQRLDGADAAWRRAWIAASVGVYTLGAAMLIPFATILPIVFALLSSRELARFERIRARENLEKPRWADLVFGTNFVTILAAIAIGLYVLPDELWVLELW